MKQSALIHRTVTGLVCGSFFFAVLLLLPAYVFSLLLVAIAAIILVVEWPRLCPRSLVWASILTIGYIMVPFSLLMVMNQTPLDRQPLMLLFIIVFSHDTGAYLIGSWCGKHRMAPTISPKKTWEGFCGGFLATLIVLFVTTSVGTIAIGWWQLPFVGLVITTAATLGDLLESWLKRKAGIKDAGTLLRGHGGLLDRFDSILLTTPLFYLMRIWFR